VNGSLFGLYHFWQPHNLPALIGLGIVFSYAVWKTRNVYVGIAIHCTLNMVGALGGYLAAMNGTIIGR
jgi:membrane protease YdiL (CAAX protease family)